jgi:hypothetical protein
MNLKRTYNPLINPVIQFGGGRVAGDKSLLTRSISFRNKGLNETGIIGLSNSYKNLVEKYGGDGIISNKVLYSEIISLDEFKELNMKEKLLFTFGEN